MLDFITGPLFIISIAVFVVGLLARAVMERATLSQASKAVLPTGADWLTPGSEMPPSTAKIMSAKVISSGVRASMDYCAQCNSCSEACHLYEMSGKNEMYRPNFRSEIFRRIYKQYVKKEPLAKWRYGDMSSRCARAHALSALLLPTCISLFPSAQIGRAHV